MKALLFINGDPPKQLPQLDHYGLIACTDGALHYLEAMDFPLEKLDFVSGDFDSHAEIYQNLRKNSDDHSELVEETLLKNFEIIHTLDQNKTDFEKSLEILMKRNCKKVDVFGASGREMDHFLGNISTAYQFKNQLSIHFFDDFSEYYFIPKKLELKNIKDKMVSLYPFPNAENITTNGLNWELTNDTLSLTSRIGIRNFAKTQDVEISYQKGELLIFIGAKYLH